LEEEFKNMTVDDINWMSYSSNRLQVPRNFEDQLLQKYMWWHHALTFKFIAYIWLCYRPLVLAEYGVRHFDVQKRSLLKPSVNKGMDLRSYVDGQHEKV
jgi:hypothetical protein